MQNKLFWSTIISFKISRKFIHNLTSNLDDRQTSHQTNRGKNVTSLADLISKMIFKKQKIAQQNLKSIDGHDIEICIFNTFAIVE